MARMYSRKKGRSGSHRPAKKAAPWIKINPQELEKIVLEMAQKGVSQAQIGLVLRDQYGIPSVKAFTKAKLSKILEKQGVKRKIPETLMSLIKRAAGLRAHLEKNKSDPSSKRGLELTESKIRRLVKYYKLKKVLPPEWKYQPEKARLLAKA